MANVQVTVSVKGLQQVMKNLRRLEKQIIADSEKGLKHALERLQDRAIANLNSSVGTGRWGPWGKSSDSIRDKTNWSINPESRTRYTSTSRLTSNSGHSAVVEFGTVGAAMVERSTPFPIGKQQGLEPIFRPRFAVQRGYHYLTRAMTSPTIHQIMTNRIADVVRQSIAKVVI